MSRYFHEHPAALYWLLAGVTLAGLLHLSHLPFGITVIFLVLLLLRLLWVRICFVARWRNAVRAAKVLLIVLVLFLLYASYGRVFSRDPGVALLTVISALKLWEISSSRDFHIAVLVGYFQTAAIFLYFQSFGSALYVVLTISVLTTALILCYDRGRSHISWRVFRLSGVLLLQAIPFMLVAFVLFPRFSAPLWGLGAPSQSAVTGVGESMAPGSISSLSSSDVVALRADFYGPAPAQRELYWRGPVLWQTDGQTWSQGSSRAGRYFGMARRSAAVAYSITVEPHQKRWLFALDVPGVAPQGTKLTPDMQLVSSRLVQSRVKYDLFSYVDYRIVPENPRRLALGLQLPADQHPRTVSLGRSWQEQGLSASEIVQSALQMLRTGGYTYTLSPPLLPDENGMDEFLFGTRQGFCEHYAAAFVLLMRAAGIPARVVLGYQGGEFNPIGAYYIVRQKDAHAWAEVWLPEEGWRRVDPTSVVAPDRLQFGIDDFLPAPVGGFMVGRSGTLSQWLRTAQFSLDMLNNRWNQWVLAYDRQRQRQLLQNMGMRGFDVPGLLLAVLKAFVLLFLLLLLWMMRRIPKQGAPIVRLYRHFCAKLARVDLPRRPSQGPLEFFASIKGRLTRSCQQEAERITEMYIRFRYGSENVGLAELKSRVRAFRPRRARD